MEIFGQSKKKASGELSTNCLDVHFGIEHFALCTIQIRKTQSIRWCHQSHYYIEVPQGGVSNRAIHNLALFENGFFMFTGAKEIYKKKSFSN